MPRVLLVQLLIALLAVLPVLSLAACGDEGEDAAPYVMRESKAKEGSGKFYMGREIARVSEGNGPEWLDRPVREASELPGRVVQSLPLDSSDVVADIGAGTGYFTFRLSPRLPRGRVLAVDIQPEMLALIRDRMEELAVDNVSPILGSEKDPHLPENAVDLALIVDSYHEFSYPREMMMQIVEALKPGGLLVLVEYRGEDPTLPIEPLHTMTEAQAKKEMAAVGLVWRDTKDLLPQQHFMIFEKPITDS